ncbi:hypothetical protein EJ06DRAFT_583034 [Trichodelitschia bisporula]|uniref:Uncharacterized protein n=1 Tax=Trichodelitschia bisporula TaxID=703511 RepID=A0A6G1HSL2_9PEZI|nr:hypothetical protein EJ06DRAFT_583034 [Trichodelitschia bisporula]
MTDSPRLRLPLPSGEEGIHAALLETRMRLELLKTDRTSYVKSEDVLELYHGVMEQVHALNRIRADRRGEQNRVDVVLDDCFQLISLAFMTIGKNNEAPAIYSVVSTIKRLLDHLTEAAFYSNKDLESITRHLDDFRKTISRGRNRHDPEFTTLLEARIGVCHEILAKLRKVLSQLTPELTPLYEQLVSILRSLSAANTRSRFPKEDVAAMRQNLQDIKEKFPVICADDNRSLEERYAEKVHQAEGLESASAEQLVSDLLTRCLLWIEIIQQQPGKINESFRPTYSKLLKIRNDLESRSLLQAWSLRETDLYDYQRRLDAIDQERTPDGNFLDPEGNPADIQTQRTLLYLLRKSYALIYHLLTSSEPVSEALLPIYNQLKTLKRCLEEVYRAGGVSSPRELYPYNMKLTSIDNMRVDGKFMIGADIPDGQAALTQLLEECFEIMFKLRETADEAEERAEAGAEEPTIGGVNSGGQHISV